jgi:hypothetical protein
LNYVLPEGLQDKGIKRFDLNLWAWSSHQQRIASQSQVLIVELRELSNEFWPDGTADEVRPCFVQYGVVIRLYPHQLTLMLIVEPRAIFAEGFFSSMGRLKKTIVAEILTLWGII